MSNINTSYMRHSFPEITELNDMFDMVTTPSSFKVTGDLENSIINALSHYGSENAPLENIFLNYVMQAGWDGALMKGFRLLMAWKLTYDLDVAKDTYPALANDWESLAIINNTIISVFQCYAVGAISSNDAPEEDWNEFSTMVEESAIQESRNPSISPDQYLTAVMRNTITKYQELYSSNNGEGKPRSKYDQVHSDFVDAGLATRQVREKEADERFVTSGYNEKRTMSSGLIEDNQPVGGYYNDAQVHAAHDPLSRGRERDIPAAAARRGRRDTEEVEVSDVVATVPKPVIEEVVVPSEPAQAIVDWASREASDILDINDINPVRELEVAEYLWGKFNPNSDVIGCPAEAGWAKDDITRDTLTLWDDCSSPTLVTRNPDGLLKTPYGRYVTLATANGAFVNNFEPEMSDAVWLDEEPVKIFNGVTMRDYIEDDVHEECLFNNKDAYGSLMEYSAHMTSLENELTALVQAGEQETDAFFIKRDAYYTAIHEFAEIQYAANATDVLHITTRPYGLRRALSQVELAREYFGKFWMEDVNWNLVDINGITTIVYPITDKHVAEVMHPIMDKAARGELDRDRNGNYIGFSPTRGMYLSIKQEYRGDSVYRTYIERVYMPEFDFTTMEEEVIEETKAKELIGKEVDKNTDTFYRCQKRIELEQDLHINKEEETLLMVSRDACVTGFTVTETEYDFMQTLRNEVASNKIVQLHQIEDLFEEYNLGSDSPLHLYLNKEIAKVIRGKSIVAASGLRISGGNDIISTWDAMLSQLVRRNPEATVWKEIQDFYPDWISEFLDGFRTFNDKKGDDVVYRITKGSPKVYIDTSLMYTDLGFKEFAIEQSITTGRLTSMVDYAIDGVLNKNLGEDELALKPLTVIITTADDTEISVARNIAGNWVGTILN